MSLKMLDYNAFWPPAHLFAQRIDRRPPYQYQPLQKWQTRLIRLLPGIFDAPIECELFVADVIAQPGFGVLELGQVVEYEAVSYSWGWPKRTAPVICNQRACFVPPTLRDAFRYLRRVHEQRWLWCDALCINQEDFAEKSKQIQIMLLIFSKAKRVIAWLGRSKDGAEESLMRKVAQSQRQAFEQCDQAATDQLIRRPWFSRTWVRQEVFAATDLKLQLEAVSCDWNSFSSFIWGHDKLGAGHLASLRDVYSSMKPTFPENFVRPPHHYVSGFGDAGNQAQVQLAKALLSILTDNQYFKVSNDRDRVYGLLGLLQNRMAGISEAMPVDYSKTVEQVYQDLTMYLINVTGSMDLLSVFRCPGTNRSLASWAIDWRTDCDKSFFLLIRNPTAECLGQARRQRYEDDGQLLVTGRCLGVVTSSVLGIQSKQQHKSFRHVDIVLDPLEPRLVDLIENGTYASRRFRFSGSQVESSSVFIAAPMSAEADDLVVELEGSQLPLLLRHTHATAHGNAFSLIGPVWFQFPRNKSSRYFSLVDLRHDVANILCHRSVEGERAGLKMNSMTEFDGESEFCQMYKALLACPLEHHCLV